MAAHDHQWKYTPQHGGKSGAENAQIQGKHKEIISSERFASEQAYYILQGLQEIYWISVIENWDYL